jgi:sortase A
VSRKPFETWTRTEENEESTVFSREKERRRLGRGTLALLGAALILLSVGWVFADVRSVGDAGAVTPKSERLWHTTLESERLWHTTPKSERLWLTIPEMKRVRDLPVYNGTVSDKGKLAAGALHLQDTDFPWQRQANVYIAGHRIGYPRTKSFLVFWNLDKLKRKDRVVLEDAEGKKYVYRVFDKMVVGPNAVSVKEPVEGKNIVTLQTCTLPNYKQRLIVQAELVTG